MKGWRRKGDVLVGVLDRQEAALVRGLVRQVREMLEVRAEEAPQDELAELTGIAPARPTARTTRSVPAAADFHRLDDDAPSVEDQNSAAALRSLHGTGTAGAEDRRGRCVVGHVPARRRRDPAQRGAGRGRGCPRSTMSGWRWARR